MRSRAAGGLWALAAAVALAFGPECGGNAPHAASDASLDAGGDTAEDTDAETLADASSDGGSHATDGPAPVDSPAESTPGPDSEPPVDAGGVYTGDACPPPLDAGLVSDWPGFRRLTELDPCCPSDVALDAAQAAPPIVWMPCRNGAPGCVEMKTGWSMVPRSFDMNHVSVSPDGTPTYLYIYRILDNTVGEEDIYDFASLQPMAAWRPSIGSAACFTEAMVGGSSATIVGFVSSGAPVGTYVASGSASALAAHPSFVSISSTNLLLQYLQGHGASDTTFGFDIGPSGLLGRASIDGGQYVAAPVQGQVTTAFVARGDVFATSTYGTAGWGQVYVMQPSNTLVLLRSNASAHVTGMATDGPNLYWTETYGSMDIGALQNDVQVWTAPYTDDPAVLAATARQIADIPSAYVPYEAIAFDGIYAVNAGTRFVVRASDGAVIQATQPGSYQWGQLTYVTSTELWAVMTAQNGPRGVAFARVTLGPWQGGE